MGKRLTKWREHEAAHAVLGKLGMTWEYRTIPASEFDVAQSRKNRARLDAPVCKETVANYAEAMRCGDVFPAIVCRHINGRYVIAGGNHRHAAAIAVNPHNKFFSCVIECTDIEFDLICRALNSVEGRGLDSEERVLHAVEMIRRYGITVSRAAKEMRVSEHVVTSRLATIAVRDAASSHGLEPSVIPASAAKRMKAISENPVVFVPMVKALESVKASTADVESLATRINQTASESDKLAVIERWKVEQSSTCGKRKGVSLNKKKGILQCVSRIESIFRSCPTCTQTQMTEDELLDVSRRISLIVQHITHLTGGGSAQAER